MQVLIISPRVPPQPGDADFGGQKRFRLFVEGIARVCTDIAFLNLVPRHCIPSSRPTMGTPEIVWGVAATSEFAPLASRTETFANHYLAGFIDARRIQAFFPYLGIAPVAAIREALARRPAMIFVDTLPAMLALLEARPAAPVLFDLADIVHRTQWRAAATRPFHPGKLAYALQVPAILAAERVAAKTATRIFVCTEQDKNFLARLGARDRAVAVPNAIAMPREALPTPAAPTLLFLGNYVYEPNAQAADRLVQRIWPIIHRAYTGARLLIAGNEIERLSSAATPKDGVDFLGFVPDLPALYARARVVCCPLDVGGGTRLKLIEAAAYGRPIVSTRVGAEGLDFRDDAEILLRDDDAGFAAACCRLFADDALCARLGAAARERTLNRYEAGTVRSQISAIVTGVLKTSHG